MVSARIFFAASAACAGVSAKSTPPAFMRPPLSTCDLSTAGPLISFATASASAGLWATFDPVGRGMPYRPKSSFDSYS